MLIANYPSVREELKMKAYTYFDKILIENSINDEEFENLSLEEMDIKIAKLRQIIKNPDLYNLKDIKYLKDKDYVISDGNATVAFEYEVSYFLNEKLKLLLSIKKVRSNDQQTGNLKDLIDSVTDDNLKNKLLEQLVNLSSESKSIDKQEQIVENSIRKDLFSQVEIAKIKLDHFERKSKIWLHIIAKESITSLIGAVLLIAFATIHIIAMFTKIQTSDIINNTFLLVLGYFFGHSVSKNKK